MIIGKMFVLTGGQGLSKCRENDRKIGNWFNPFCDELFIWSDPAI